MGKIIDQRGPELCKVSEVKPGKWFVCEEHLYRCVQLHRSTPGHTSVEQFYVEQVEGKVKSIPPDTSCEIVDVDSVIKTERKE